MSHDTHSHALRVEAEISSRTPEWWATRMLDAIADGAARHDTLFPGDPVKALRYCRDRAIDGLKDVEMAERGER